MNLAMRMLGRPVVASRRLVAVTAFQESPGAEPRYGALLLNAPPVRIRVSDARACDLPDAQSIWRPLAIACFDHPGRGPVPVLDLAGAFSRP